MNTCRKTAVTVGVLFLTAMVASLVGGVWLETFLGAPDYLAAVSANANQVVVGVLLELTNCVAVIGIAVALFPILKEHSEALALGYVGIRVVEAAVLAVAAVSPLSLATLGQEYLAAGSSDASALQVAGAAFLTARGHLTGLLTSVFFGLGALLLYFLLYQSKLVPRFIAVWGFTAVVLVLVWNIVEAFGISISAGMILALPMILNEIFLGIWLIAKGFSPAATVFGSSM